MQRHKFKDHIIEGLLATEKMRNSTAQTVLFKWKT